jgi:hypothetical protein
VVVLESHTNIWGKVDPCQGKKLSVEGGKFWLLQQLTSNRGIRVTSHRVQVQKTSKVLSKRLLSKSEDVDFVNKFNIVFTMTKERIY